MVIELRVVQFWSEIILVISNRTRAARSFDFEITRMISDQIALHSVQLPLLNKTNCFHQLKILHLGTNSISGVAAFLLRKYISFSDYHPIRSSVRSFLV